MRDVKLILLKFFAETILAKFSLLSSPPARSTTETHFRKAAVKRARSTEDSWVRELKRDT